MARNSADVRLNFTAQGADRVKAVFTQVDTQLKALNNSPVSIKIGADDDNAADKIGNVFRQLEALNHSRANINMKFPDYESARAKLDELKNMTSALDGKVIRESIKIDGLGNATVEFAALAKLQDEQDKKRSRFSFGGPGSGESGGGSGGGAGGILSALPGSTESLLNPYTITAGLAALPFAAQAAAGGITLAFGGALAGIAILGASKAKSVQDSFAKLKAHASSDLTDIGKPFVPVMNSILRTARDTMDKLTPVFESAVSGFSGPFQNLSDTFVKGLDDKNVQNAIKSLGSAFGSILKSLTPQLPGDINSIADGLKRVGEAVSRNPKAIADFVSTLFHIAGFALDAVAGLTNVATYVEQHFIPAFDRARHDIAHWWDDLIHDLIFAWDTYWDNTIGRTIRGGHDIEAAFNAALSAVTGAWNRAWSALQRAFLIFIRDGVLTPLGWIIDGAARAFGWIPGIGSKLKTAAAAFDHFRDSVNNAIGGIQGKTVKVGVAMTASSNPYPGGISGRAATGGMMRGPGTGTSDSILARVSNGEYVLRASAVSRYGVGFLNALNTERYAAGGGVNISTSTPGAGSVGSAIWSSVVKTVKSAWEFVPAIGGSGGGAGVARWAGVILQALSLLGQSPAWLSTVERRMNQESGGNPLAINLWDSNAAAGDPSRGLMQTIGSTFAAFAGPFRALGIYNPLANTYAGLNYALHTYGSLAALNRPGGYSVGGPVSFDRGGYLAPHSATLAVNGTNRYERVGGGDGVTYNVYVNAAPLTHPKEIGAQVISYIKEFERGNGRSWRN